MKLHLLPTITLLPAPHDTADDQQVIEDWSRGLDWVKWLLGSVRARVEVLLVEDVSDWNAAAESVLREASGPALKSAWQSAHANDLAGLIAASSRLSSQLSPAACQRSLQAGAVLLKSTKHARYQGVLGRLREAVEQGKCESHIAIVWAAVGHFFQLSLTNVIAEYLRLAARLHRLPRASCEAAASRAMQRCGLTEVSRKLIGTLSKGYQQRVGIAQAIVHEPDLVILDEPTVGLDPNQILDIRTLIRELGRAHSVILSTHILTEVEAVCDRVQILHHGEVVFSNTIAGLREFQRGRTVTISLHRPPPVETLRGIEGVSTVDADGDGRFRIRFAPDVDPTAALVTRAGAEDWGLHQLTPAQTSLEDVFVHLTRGDTTGDSKQ